MNVPVWERGGWSGLPTLEGESEADVCVVGLGGSGLAAVRALVERGVRVVGVDAGRVAGGAAGRNGGFLLAGCYHFHHDAVARHGRARAVAIHRATAAEIERMAAETPEAVRTVGSLRIALSPAEEADCFLQAEAMRADGLPVEAYEGPEGRGLLFPADAAFDPLLRCRILAEREVARGARLFEGSPAVRIGDGEVRTARGRVRCDSVVVAVDGGVEFLLPELAGRVRTARLQMLATAPTEEVRVPRPVYARYGMEYWQQLSDGRLALGGFRDRGGEGEWTAEGVPASAVQEALEGFLRGHLGVRAPVTHRWAAPVGFTASGLPVLEEVRPGVVVAGGYCGTGNVIGAVCGAAAAARVLGEPSEGWALFGTEPSVRTGERDGWPSGDSRPAATPPSGGGPG